jgi:hypothetical protein
VLEVVAAEAAEAAFEVPFTLADVALEAVFVALEVALAVAFDAMFIVRFWFIFCVI